MKLVRSLMIATLALVIFSGAVALAEDETDIYLEEVISTSSPGQTSPPPVTIQQWISGKKLKRVVKGGLEVFIFRADLGKTYVLNTARQAYFEVPFSLMRKMTEEELSQYMPTVDGKAQIPDKLYQTTGRKKKINGWNTFEMKVLTDNKDPKVDTQTTIWVTKDTGLEQDLVVRIFKITMGEDISPELKKLFEKMTAMEGFPVETVTTTKIGERVSTTVKTVQKIEKRQMLNPGLFEIPEGYTKLDLPKPQGM